MFLSMSDVRIMHASCSSMSKCATAQATPVLPVSADAGPGDSSNTVDSNNTSDTLELARLIHLIKIIDIVDDNVNDYYVVNQRVVPNLVGSPRVCAQAKLVVMRAPRLVIHPPGIPTCPCLSLFMTLVVLFSCR